MSLRADTPARCHMFHGTKAISAKRAHCVTSQCSDRGNNVPQSCKKGRNDQEVSPNFDHIVHFNKFSDKHQQCTHRLERHEQNGSNITGQPGTTKPRLQAANPTALQCNTYAGMAKSAVIAAAGMVMNPKTTALFPRRDVGRRSNAGAKTNGNTNETPQPPHVAKKTLENVSLALQSKISTGKDQDRMCSMQYI